MVTIRELLKRIQWDPEFGAAEFTLACLDRVSATLEQIPLSQVRLEPRNAFSFEVTDGNGTGRRIPFHRVRAVYRNGERIWARPEPPTQPQ